jgi:hypothetical protein
MNLMVFDGNYEAAQIDRTAFSKSSYPTEYHYVT